MANKIFDLLVPVYLILLIASWIGTFGYMFSKVLNNMEPNIGVFFGLFFFLFFLGMLGLGFTIYMIVDCVKRKLKDSTKITWILLMFFFNMIAATIYYYMYARKNRI